jgi:hypothetical protein
MSFVDVANKNLYRIVGSRRQGTAARSHG